MVSRRKSAPNIFNPQSIESITIASSRFGHHFGISVGRRWSSNAGATGAQGAASWCDDDASLRIALHSGVADFPIARSSFQGSAATFAPISQIAMSCPCQCNDLRSTCQIPRIALILSTAAQHQFCLPRSASHADNGHRDPYFCVMALVQPRDDLELQTTIYDSFPRRLLLTTPRLKVCEYCLSLLGRTSGPACVHLRPPGTSTSRNRRPALLDKRCECIYVSFPSATRMLRFATKGGFPTM